MRTFVLTALNGSENRIAILNVTKGASSLCMGAKFAGEDVDEDGEISTSMLMEEAE